MKHFEKNVLDEEHFTRITTFIRDSTVKITQSLTILVTKAVITFYN